MAEDATRVANEVLGRVRESWGDGEAFAALYTQDADLLHGNGIHDGGRAAIARTMGMVFGGPFRGTRPRLGLSEARALTEDVVLARVTLAVDGLPQPGPPMAGMVVIVREGDAWRVASWQNTPAPQQT
jgi:uncharacterized protein (TIGR02246 family)